MGITTSKTNYSKELNGIQYFQKDEHGVLHYTNIFNEKKEAQVKRLCELINEAEQDGKRNEITRQALRKGKTSAGKEIIESMKDEKLITNAQKEMSSIINRAIELNFIRNYTNEGRGRKREYLETV